MAPWARTFRRETGLCLSCPLSPPVCFLLLWESVPPSDWWCGSVLDWYLGKKGNVFSLGSFLWVCRFEKGKCKIWGTACLVFDSFNHEQYSTMKPLKDI